MTLETMVDLTPPKPVIIPKGEMVETDFETYFWKWYGFLIPDKQALAVIKEYTNGKKILEIGAGTGLWSNLLQNNKVEVITTDLLAPIYKQNWYRRFWTDVEELDCVEAVKKYNDIETLMLLWPTQESVWVDALKEFKGNKFIYGGKSGPEELHELIDKEWEIEASKELNYFPTTNHVGLTGKKLKPILYLMKRKENKK